MSTRFVFRADASSAIGFGHLSRAVALATAAARAGAQVAIVAARPEPALRLVAESAGISVHAIDVVPGTPEDARATAGVAGFGARVVVDGYAFHSEYLDALRGDERVVAYVDDLARERLRCDVVINPNVSGTLASYDTPRETIRLLGAAYAIVHDRFIAARRRREAERAREPEIAENLLVTMGGSDPAGATVEVVDALAALEAPRMKLRVIVGAANPRIAEIRAHAAACDRHDIDVRGPVEDMAAEMSWADLAITASGVTSSELSCVGVPGVSFAIVDNQEPIAAELSRLGMFHVLPTGSAGSVALAQAVVALATDVERRARMVETQRRTIDGLGKDRIVAQLLALRAGEGHTPGPSGGDGD